jgi:hypothetical protein
LKEPTREANSELRVDRRVACRTEADEVRRFVRATRGPGEDVVHMGAVALEVGAALNTAMPVATQHLASHLLPF